MQCPYISVVIEANGDVRPCFFHTSPGRCAVRVSSDIISRELPAFRDVLAVQEQSGLSTLRVLDAHELEECPVELTPTWQGAETMRAFDGVAGEYHQSNVDNPILSRTCVSGVHATMQRHVACGARARSPDAGPGTDHPTLVGTDTT